jgi:hypothetical protein
MKSKAYNIVLIPELSLIKKSIRLSKKLELLDSHFTLDNKTFFPHVSLYMTQLNELGLEKSMEALSVIAKDNNSIEVTSKGYRYIDEYIDVQHIRTKELIFLQKEVLKSINPIREGLRDKDKLRLKNATGEIRSNLLEYGYRSVGNLFYPHITFTRFKNDEKQSIESFPLKETFNGKLLAIGIFEMGDNGTCVKKIGEWVLSKK